MLPGKLTTLKLQQEFAFHFSIFRVELIWGRFSLLHGMSMELREIRYWSMELREINSSIVCCSCTGFDYDGILIFEKSSSGNQFTFLISSFTPSDSKC